MKTITKTLVLVTGLGVGLALTGSLLAHGPGGFMGGPGGGYGNQQMQPGYGNPGYMGGPGMMHGRGMNPSMMQGRGMGPGMMHGNGMGPGMMQGKGIGPGMTGPMGANQVQHLEQIKATLGITADQEAAWTTYAEALQTHMAQGQATHQAMMSPQSAGNFEARNEMHKAMWESRQKVSEALQALRTALTPEQQQRALGAFGQGCFG